MLFREEPGTLRRDCGSDVKVSLKHLEAPGILYNLNGYYNSLKELLEHMIEKGLSTKERQEGIYFCRESGGNKADSDED